MIPHMKGLLVFIEMKQFFFSIQNGQLKKASFSSSANSQYFLMKKSWIAYKKNKLPHLNENKQPIHMRYHLFLHYGWFLHNLGKDFIRTNMHTTALIEPWLSRTIYKTKAALEKSRVQYHQFDTP